jgi:hypothetical protein
VFFIESEEEFALCPHCGECLDYHSRVIRPLRDILGEKASYSIRVLKCNNDACPTKYHRELPDIITPYKRYGTEVIEQAIELGNNEVTVAVDESTIYRWRKWFLENATNIMMALISVIAVVDESAETSSLEIWKRKSNKPFEAIQEIVARKTKWLNETARILVNSSKWPFNRSAFLTT